MAVVAAAVVDEGRKEAAGEVTCGCGPPCVLCVDGKKRARGEKRRRRREECCGNVGGSV